MVSGYEPAWRIRQVVRIDGRARTGCGGDRLVSAQARPTAADHGRGAHRDRASGRDRLAPGRIAPGGGRRGRGGRRRPGRPRRRRRLARVGGAAATRARPRPVGLRGARRLRAGHDRRVGPSRDGQATVRGPGRGGACSRGDPPLRRRGRADVGPADARTDARHRELGAPGAGRSGGRDHSLELPGRPRHLEARAGAGGRLRGRGEARRSRHRSRPGRSATSPSAPACRRGWSAASPGTARCIGEALSTHPLVAKVAFTGSRRVAEQIAGWASPRLKALSLELGGHGALVVLPDADLDVAAEVAVMQGYVNSGQACYAVNRVLAPPDLGDGLLERMRRGSPRIELGPDGHRPRPRPPPHADRGCP